MPTYQTPGIYIQEKPAGSKPIQGVGTSMPAFIGFTETCPSDSRGKPRFVANWTQFQNEYGGFVNGFYTPLAIYGYFMNGGSACYVLSLATKTDADATSSGQTRALISASSGQNALELRGKNPAAPGQDIVVEISDASGDGVSEDQFTVTIRAPGSEPQTIANVTMSKARGARNAVETITRESPAVQASEIEGQGTLVERRPKNGTYQLVPEPTRALASAKTFEGNPAARTGIGALEELSDVTMLLCPDLMTGYKQGKLTEDDVIGVHKAMLAHCENMRYRFAILDALPGMGPDDVLKWRQDRAMYNSKYGALYYPWIEIPNPAGKNGDKTVIVPPSGHIAGVYARVDQERGVHKAPANEELRGVIRLERNLLDAEQGRLNVKGINCIRAFPGRGIRIWGARTLSDDTEWTYVPVRRLFNFVEQSIFEGTQWVVFEPNDLDLWERVKRSITAFLTRVWRDGALFGATPEEAFYVKCDAELNPPENRRLGMLTVEIGLAPVFPAEFVIFRFSQMSDGGDVSE